MKVAPIRFLFFALILTAAHGQLTYAQDLQILTTEIPPIAFTKDGKVTGFCTEVVEDIQRRLNNHASIQVLPWKRAYQMAQERPNTALYCTMRTAERENLFKWVGPVTTSQTNFYAKSGSTIRINNLEDAKKQGPILIPRGFYSYQYLQGLGFQNLEAVDSAQIMLKMLLAGRRSLMVLDSQLLPSLLEKINARPEEVEMIQTALTTRSYVAFSKATADETVAKWQSALDQMKREGSFQRLHKNWFPDKAPARVNQP